MLFLLRLLDLLVVRRVPSCRACVQERQRRRLYRRLRGDRDRHRDRHVRGGEHGPQRRWFIAPGTSDIAIYFFYV